jgi:glycosyltransferase involved in cell wall biosynthesis
MSNKVSIIIPTYNRDKLIIDCLENIENQSYDNFEIIVVDDGSIDNTIKNINEFKKINKYHNIKIIKQKHLGVMKSRINGLKNATGEYVTFVDSDDLISKDYIYRLVRSITLHNSTIAVGRLCCLVDKKITLKTNKLPNVIYLAENRSILLSIPVQITGKLYRKDILKLTDYNLKMDEDLAITYNLFANQGKISCDNSAFYYWQSTQNSLSSEIRDCTNIDSLKDILMALEIEYSLFLQDNLLTDYYAEIEALFVKTILEKIMYIKYTKKLEAKSKTTLINILTYYLNSKFPDWLKNKYYKKNFIDFQIYPDVLSAISTRGIFSKRKSIKYDYNETISNYEKALFEVKINKENLKC